MDKQTPVFSLETLTPYIRLTNKGNNYTLWVMVPLPVNYHIILENNPQLKIDERKNQVDVNIGVSGPVGKPAEEWFPVPIKVSLPSPTKNQFGIDMQTTILTTIVVTDTGDVGDDDGGASTSKYEDSTEE